MIYCAGCNSQKAETEFYRSSARASGYQYHCKECKRGPRLASYHANPRSDEQRAKKLEYDRARRVELGERLRAYDRTRAQTKSRKAKATRQGRRRKAGIGFATPSWISEGDRKSMASIYMLAAKLEKLFGVKYHVDHIVPLRGKDVCGLHVPWNLQILEASLNRAKSNNPRWVYPAK